MFLHEVRDNFRFRVKMVTGEGGSDLNNNGFDSLFLTYGQLYCAVARVVLLMEEGQQGGRAWKWN